MSSRYLDAVGQAITSLVRITDLNTENEVDLNRRLRTHRDQIHELEDSLTIVTVALVVLSIVVIILAGLMWAGSV